MTGEAAPAKKVAGRVALVGAGPGDPELLTIRAAKLISEAEVIFSDRLVGKGVLDLVPPGAEVVHVGKSKGEHSVPQDEIHRRMIEAASAGKRVVRLKGGDPFIFGRGGEELEALRAAGIEVEVVPGISAALGCAASAQIPLTHRDIAQAVTFVTGHAALGQEPDLDWNALARPNQTVVVFMGVGNADAIAARLIAAGRDPATPVAVIENGTRENEIKAFGALGSVADVIQASGIQGPALLIIGEVAAVPAQARAISTAHPDESRDPGQNESLVPDSSSNPEQGSAAALGPDFRRDERGLAVPEGVPSLSDLWRLVS